MRLKTVEHDGKTYAEIQDGKPVYLDDAGKEIAFDAPGTVATISRLNGEAKSHRERAQAAETSLKAFDGLTDPAAALKALEIVKSLDQKKLIDAGEVEKVKAEAIKAVEEKYRPTVEKAETLEKALRQEKIGGSFARSKYIAEKLAVPVPMVEKTFGEFFTIEGGKVVAKDASGNAIYSKSKPGEIADFDEAMEVLVEGFAFKDSILKGTGNSGTGARHGNGGGTGGKTITRAEFDSINKSDPARAAKMVTQDGMTVTD